MVCRKLYPGCLKGSQNLSDKTLKKKEGGESVHQKFTILLQTGSGGANIVTPDGDERTYILRQLQVGTNHYGG